MTCIVYHKNKLYADSMVYANGEFYHSLTKIQGIILPFQIKCDKEGFQFDDIVHGWSGTGAPMPMQKFVDSLESDSKDPDAAGSIHTVLFYRIAQERDLVVAQGNLFEIFLIGEKKNHSFRFDHEGFKYTPYDKDTTIAMGSGHELCMNYIKAQPQEKTDILRAMFETFFHDPSSGGFVDCWEMTTDKNDKPLFQRFGLHHDIPKEYISGLLETVYPNRRRILPTYVRPEKLTRIALDLDNQVNELTAELDRAKKLLSRYRKKLGIREPRVKKAAPAQQ